MTDMKFLLLRLSAEGDPWHTYMAKSPVGMFATLEKAMDYGYQMLHDQETDDFEVYELLETGEFEFVY